MNLKVIVAISLIAVVPVYAQAQIPSAPKVTKADAQRVPNIIQSDKAKTKIYCEMAKIGNQLEQINEEANPKKFEELSRKMEEKTRSRIRRVDRWSSGHRSAFENRL